MKSEFKINITALIVGVVVGVALWIVLMFLTPLTVEAAPQHGFGTGQGRTGPVNINDFHTASWERFSFSYEFTSGQDYRYDLGRSTTFFGNVPLDVHTANIRRDANVALRPPCYGIFSGYIPTDPSNLLFPQPVNPNFWRVAGMDDPNVLSRYDTLQFGVNAQPLGNPLNMHNVGDTGLIPSTSLSGGGITPIGANNMNAAHFLNDGTAFSETSNNSSIVTMPAPGGFLPSTSLR